jgi:hypothetical protein
MLMMKNGTHNPTQSATASVRAVERSIAQLLSGAIPPE